VELKKTKKIAKAEKMQKLKTDTVSVCLPSSPHCKYFHGENVVRMTPGIDSTNFRFGQKLFG
jgi:hypothetical protein